MTRIVDYGDLIYDCAFNKSFHQRFESIQYNAVIAITGAIRGTSLEKLFQDLGLETLKSRHWSRKFYILYCYIYLIKYFIVNHVVIFLN